MHSFVATMSCIYRRKRDGYRAVFFGDRSKQSKVNSSNTHTHTKIKAHTHSFNRLTAIVVVIVNDDYVND